ncbi:unnamed protein product [Choristocarpus tenellus]
MENTLSSAQHGMKTVINSKTAKDLHKKSAQVAKSMGTGAKKLWKTFNKVGGGSQLPSLEALDNLHNIAAMLDTPFSKE